MVEYIELHNTTAATVSLDGWVYKNVTGKKTKALPEMDLPAGGYAVLLDQEDALSFPVQTLLIPIEKFPALNDKGAVLQLWDAARGKIEEVAYEAAPPECRGNEALQAGIFLLIHVVELPVPLILLPIRRKIRR